MDKDTEDSAAPSSPAAVALALGSADPAKANAFLDEQAELTRLQIEELKNENAIRHWSLRVRHISDVMKMAFELAVAVIALLVVFGIGAALWSASQADGLVVEAFSVPPDMAARGLTGEVVAAKVLDRLAAMQQQTVSSRAASSYANNWGDDIKVQIPETGISIGELNRYLRGWLGHETHITGEVYRTAAGLSMTARAGADASPTFTASDAGFDTLVQKAAESVYRSTQPYRYAVYLDAHGRLKEGRTVYEGLAANGTPVEQAWAYIGLSNDETQVGNYGKANRNLRQAVALKPDLLLAYENLANNESTLQHDEQALAAYRKIATLEAGRVSKEEANVEQRLLQDKAQLAAAVGDYHMVQDVSARLLLRPNRNNIWESARMSRVAACAALHDAQCTQDLWTALPPPPQNAQFAMLNRDVNYQSAEAALEHWQSVLALEAQIVPVLKSVPANLGNFFLYRAEYPLAALAHAELGDFKTAHAEADGTPLDCLVCLRSRGTIAALEKDSRASDRWFAQAAKLGPSINLVWNDWGVAKLLRGDAAGAAEKFAMAVKVAPNDADGYEGWGEALMAQNRSDLALEKFAKAGAIAPNWGELHLKWGEALVYAGQKDEARKQFARAAQLSLTAEEKAELARHRV